MQDKSNLQIPFKVFSGTLDAEPTVILDAEQNKTSANLKKKIF